MTSLCTRCLVRFVSCEICINRTLKIMLRQRVLKGNANFALKCEPFDSLSSAKDFVELFKKLAENGFKTPNLRYLKHSLCCQIIYDTYQR